MPSSNSGSMQPYFAEFVGTFVLVLCGVGSAVLAGNEIGNLGVAFAFGLALMAMIYSVGRVSGAHVNPAVSLGLAIAGRFEWRRFPGYVAAQVVGATAASWLLFLITSGHPLQPTYLDAGFASNGFGVHSPVGFGLLGCLLGEVFLTSILVFTILGATDPRAPASMAGIAIGLALTLIILVGIPLTNGSFNPARSTGPATVMGGWAVRQLWLFWLAPLLGGALAAGAWRVVSQPMATPVPAPAPSKELGFDQRKGA